MSARPAHVIAPNFGDYVPMVLGIGSTVMFFLAIEALVRTGAVNRFIVPPPSEVIGSFWRVIVEEDIPRRFLLTATECLTAGVMLTVFES